MPWSSLSNNNSTNYKIHVLYVVNQSQSLVKLVKQNKMLKRYKFFNKHSIFINKKTITHYIYDTFIDFNNNFLKNI